MGSVRHLVTVVLAAWFLLVTCSGQPDDITTAAAERPTAGDGPLDRGVQQFFRGEYAAAIESLEMSIDQHGTDGARADRSAERQAHQYLARCYLTLGKFTDAGRSVKQAIDIGPDDAELYNIEGAVHLARAFARAQYGDTDSAATAFHKAIAIDPSHAKSHYNLGLVYAYRDCTALARDAYLRALKLDSSLAPAHKKLGLMFREEGNLDSALAHFEMAVSMTPEDAESVFQIGFLNRVSGRYEEALEALERAAALNPNSPQVQFNLASVYLRVGRRQEGQEAMKRSEILRRHERGIDSQMWMPSGGGVTIGPATSRYNIALNHALRGDYEQAILEYRNTIEIDPELTKAYIGLGILLAWTDDPQGAVDCFLKAIEQEPDDAVSHMRLGAIYLKQKQYEESRAALRRALELDEDLPEAAFSLGLLEARIGNAEAAIVQFSSAAAMRPDYPEAYMNLGVTYMKQSRIQEAAANYLRVVQLDPANGRGHLYLSDAYARLDSTDKSRFHRDLAKRLAKR